MPSNPIRISAILVTPFLAQSSISEYLIRRDAFVMSGESSPAPEQKILRPPPEPVLSTSSYWLRAPAGGIFRGTIELGTWVREGDVLGKVSDPLGEEEMPVIAPREGIVIGATTSPLVNEGDALLHVAQPHKPGDASDRIQELVPDATDAPDLGRMPQG